MVWNAGVGLNIYSKLPHPSTKQLKDRYSLIEQLYEIILSNTAVNNLLSSIYICITFLCFSLLINLV